MSARLIINADDFGLTAGINRSIEELHHAGVLRSATLMANGPAFADAVAIAHRNPSLGIGCHIVLTDGFPLSNPRTIPSLLGSDGASFRPSLYGFTFAALSGRLRAQDIRTEALAQIRKLQGEGLSVTHLDTHKHTHVFEAISNPLLEIARQASIRAIRNPFEQPWSLTLGQGTGLRRLQLGLVNHLQPGFRANPNLRDGNVATTNGTIGVCVTGDLDAATLRDLLRHLPKGTWELVCHPGYNDSDLDQLNTRLRGHREIEHAALLEVVPEILSQPDPPSLIHYGELEPRP